MPKKKKMSRLATKDSNNTSLSFKSVTNLFIIKAIFMILLAALLAFSGASFFSSVIDFVIMIFFMINGLVMIVSALMDSTRRPRTLLLIPALIFGGLSILSGTLPLIFVNTLLPLVTLVMILGLALDLLYTLITINSLSPCQDKQWWMIASGLIGVLTLSNLIFSSLVYFNYWIIFYLVCQGIIYFCAPLFLSDAQTKK